MHKVNFLENYVQSEINGEDDEKFLLTNSISEIDLYMVGILVYFHPHPIFDFD